MEENDKKGIQTKRSKGKKVIMNIESRKDRHLVKNKKNKKNQKDDEENKEEEKEIKIILTKKQQKDKSTFDEKKGPLPFNTENKEEEEDVDKTQMTNTTKTTTTITTNHKIPTTE